MDFLKDLKYFSFEIASFLGIQQKFENTQYEEYVV